MTWVKICGITNLEDAMTAVEAGADALGFVFYEKSPRYVTPEGADKVLAVLPKNIEKVGVFADAPVEQVEAVLSRVSITAIQVSVKVSPADTESCAYCFEELRHRRPHLKLIAAVSMQGEGPEHLAMACNPDSVYSFLLDSGFNGLPGGTGQRFDWAATERAVKVIKSLGNVVVAGGLTPTNVAEAMRILKPWGVDVSSGVEAKPGKKDPEKVRAFIAAVRAADQKK